MTREEWYADYRAKRIEHRKNRKPTCSAVREALNELYTFVLYGKDEVKYQLIKKYESKVSPQLLYERKKLREKGVEQGKNMMRELVYARNPLLDFMKS